MEVTVSFPKSLCSAALDAALDAQDIPFQCKDNVVNVGNIKAKLQTELSIFFGAEIK